ncbi:MAG: F0F1 ATP synthase subunit alpha [Synechococcaceae cyanobacterium]|nr:F0F1 ATP synthase subunit alpha [Synechococcaceae cyanobacterium]
MPSPSADLEALARDTFARMGRALAAHRPAPTFREVGAVRALRPGIALVEGLPGVQAEELVHFPASATARRSAPPLAGLVLDLDPDSVGVVLLGDHHGLRAGDEVRRTGRVLDVPVGEALLGRIVNALGGPLDGRGPVDTGERLPAERPAAAILERAPVTVPLQTGWKVVDALIPIGRGQRELVIGDRQTGKTTIAVDTILNQKGQDVICLYCAIGQRSSATADVVATLRAHGAMDHCIVVVAGGHDPPGLQYITPYAATTMAEYFAEQGRDVLIVYDDLTRHAHAYRELSLLLRRPPGREAYPGDIFYLHSRLLERATHLAPQRGGGSLTAMPIIETQAQNISAYIPTNLISITDGQIYLSPDLMRRSHLPAVDVGRSVSRVGARTQLPAFQALGSALRLSFAQFQEMELFTRFGTQLDAHTRRLLARGRRIREALKQREHQPLSVCRQVAILQAVSDGLLDERPVAAIGRIEARLPDALAQRAPGLCARIEAGETLGEGDAALLAEALSAAAAP